MSTMFSLPRRWWVLFCLGTLLAAGAVRAQGLPDPAQMNAVFQKQRQANEQALRQYTWKARTELRVDGQVKSNVLQMVRYDATGALQKTVIGGEQAKERTRLIQLSIWIDPQTREKRRLEILTALNGDTVQIVSQFGKLPDGVGYTSLTTVEIKARKLQMITENFDFAHPSLP